MLRPHIMCDKGSGTILHMLQIWETMSAVMHVTTDKRKFSPLRLLTQKSSNSRPGCQPSHACLQPVDLPDGCSPEA